MKIHLIKEKTIRNFVIQYSDSLASFEDWITKTKLANWQTPKDINSTFSTADILGNSSSRVVFNIAGNKYRLVVEMQYRAGIVWVKFVGTHAQYDQINVESVNEY